MPRYPSNDLPRSVRIALENAEAEAQRRADEEAAVTNFYFPGDLDFRDGDDVSPGFPIVAD